MKPVEINKEENRTGEEREKKKNVIEDLFCMQAKWVYMQLYAVCGIAS